MADTAEVRFSATGTEDVVSAVGRIRDSMTGLQGQIATGVGKAVGAVTDQLAGMAQTALHVATAMGTINIAAAVEGAKAFNEQIARMSVAGAGSVETLNARFTDIRKSVLVGEPELQAYSSALGKVAYDFDAAIGAQKALGEGAIQTGRSAAELQPFGAVLLTALGAGKNFAEVMAQIDGYGRNAQGGIAGFRDQVTALAPALSQVAAQGRDAALAFASMLSAGSTSPAMAQRVQGATLGRIEGDAVAISRTLGYDILDEHGHVKDPGKVADDLKNSLKRRGYSKQQQLIALRNYFGNEAGSELFHADTSPAARAKALASERDYIAAMASESFVTMSEGQREALRLENAAKQREAVEPIVGFQDTWSSMFASHPVAGLVAGGALGSVGTAALRGAAGAIRGATAAAGSAAAGTSAAGAEIGNAYALSNFVANGAGSASAGGSIFAPLAAIAAGIFGQGAVVSSLGEDRESMGEKWRKEHQGVINAEKAAMFRGTAPSDPLKSVISALVSQGADPKLAEATAKAIGSDLRSGGPLRVQLVNVNTPDAEVRMSRAAGNGAQ